MLDRTVAPASRRVEHISIKQPEKYVTSNGIEVFAIKAGTQEIVKIELVFEAGKWKEDKPGISFFTGKMLREGSGNYGSFEISNLFESFGAHLEISPAFDFTTITVYCLTKYLHQLLPVIRSMIESPTFPEEELDTLKNIQLQTLRINNEKNSFVAGRKLRESLFGSNHPYGHILEEVDINSVGRKDLKDNFKNSILNKPFTIIVSGLFEEDSINSISKTFDNILLEANFPTLEYNPESGPKEVTIDKKESLQSAIRLGCMSISMNHKEYAGLMVVNEILGGYFGSRLMKNIREEKGLTYGIYSSLSTLKHGSFFSISADIKKEFNEQAFHEIKSEIKLLRNEKVSNTELETVRNYMLGQIQASITTPFSLASKFKNIHFNGLDYSYYSNLIETIKTISPEEILALSEKHLMEDKMIQVRVG